ncbi:hypothetical protein AN963_24210 [Brevibacillus choshinensis]|uniref:Uncharacterized protein n=1 Tax=Brevibacillus choshinensis TaxID=54911 RepID=A0ABR5N2J3_BRECH|nr:hypothetical protein [Brevibacillus choshinensis]KQL44503.1 hypothetical protein AN963_24210 [Brevibacillus choshinensis]
MDMISAKDRQRIQVQMQRDESRIVNIVLNDAQQVAGEIEKATHEGIFMVDGRYYGYEDIKEINGL